MGRFFPPVPRGGGVTVQPELSADIRAATAAEVTARKVRLGMRRRMGVSLGLKGPLSKAGSNDVMRNV